MRRFVTVALLLALSARPLFAGDWPQFRGPRGDGQAESAGVPTIWGGLFAPPTWQAPIDGGGWSSPIVVGDRIWLTSAVETAMDEVSRERKLAESRYTEDAFRADASVTLLAIELDARSGEILRRVELLTCDHPAPIHAVNSYASPTPATDGEHLYCHFGSLGTVCLALTTGSVVWSRCFAVDDITGPGASPVLCGGCVVLACDGADDQFVVAIDKRTGEQVWRTPRPKIEAAEEKMRRAFSTPLLIEHGGRSQLVSPAAQWTVAYDPASGEELWRVHMGSGYAVVPRPVYRQGLVYVTTGYPKPELWALRVDGNGDVSETHVAWAYPRQVPEISSPVVIGGEIYFVSSRGIATCLDAMTGEAIWQHRLEGSFAASPLASDGRLYFTNDEGMTFVIRAGREYHELARNRLFGRTMASLSVAGDSLLIRSAGLLYCVR